MLNILGALTVKTHFRGDKGSPFFWDMTHNVDQRFGGASCFHLHVTPRIIQIHAASPRAGLTKWGLN
jgi:hypothetical protein